MMKVVTCSDGSAKAPANKGGPKEPGGCASVVEWVGGEHEVKVVCSGESATSIGRMELLGVITGMRYLRWLSAEGGGGFNLKDVELEMIVDSMFVFRSATGSAGRSKNLDLWRDFDRLGALFGSVSIEHRPRNTLRGMEEADRVSGMIRKAIVRGDNDGINRMVDEGGYVILDFAAMV